jgi:hypothetical protein
MISDQERETARLGTQLLDRALVALGRRPAVENEDFRAADPVVGDLPNTVLEKPGVAPLRFIFGPQLDVWVGPFSEVVTATISEATADDAQRQIERLLRSSVDCRIRRNSAEITLQVASDEPWLRLKVRAAGLAAALEPRYAPYVS